MVHARYGSKDAILDTLFSTEYEKKLSPDADPDSTGLQQALAHVDRITDLYAEDPDLLRAIFVLTFEAAKAKSQSHPYIRMWLKRAADGRNANALTSDRLTDMGGGPTFYNCLIQVERCGD